MTLGVEGQQTNLERFIDLQKPLDRLWTLQFLLVTHDDGGNMKYIFENYSLDSHDLTLSEEGIVKKIEPQVFALIELLIKNAGRTVTKSEIIDVVWQGRHISDAAINSRLHAARAAINDDGTQQRLIRTVPNVGLRFTGEVSVEPTVFDKAEIETKAEFEKQSTKQSPFQRFFRPGLLLLLLVPIGLFTVNALKGEDYPDSEFIYTGKAAIFGHNTTRIWGLSAQECMRACLEERSFYCKSIDYTRVEKMCDLSDKSAEDVGGLKTDYPGSPHDHYSRKIIDNNLSEQIDLNANTRTTNEIDMTLKSALALVHEASPKSINLAAEQYLMVLANQPNSVDALSGLAETTRLQIIYGAIDQDEALPYLRQIIEKATSLSSDDPEVHTAATALSLIEENYETAIDYADKAIAHRHTHGARVHHYKALALNALGRNEEAAEEHKQVLFHKPDYRFAPQEQIIFQNLSIKNQ